MGTNLWIALWLLRALVADLVVVEPDGADPALTRVIVDSYRGAVGDVDVLEDGTREHWYARVTWDESKLHARIEIRRGATDAPVQTVREVEFSETDAVVQRHRAVGLIIAAHVVASAHPREDTSVSPPPAVSAADANPEVDVTSEDDQAEAQAVFEAPRLPTLGVDLALLAGPALDQGAPAFGVMLRGFARPFATPLAAVISLRAARRFEAPELMFWSATAGVLARLQPRASPFAAEVRVEAVAQRVQAQAESANRDDSGGAWRGGGQLGLEAHARVAPRVSLFAGAELRMLLPNVHLEVQGRELGVARALDWDALAGIRYAH